jgi:uncharacterized protein
LAYTPTMEFEWDDAKSAACFDERGFDFEYAVHAFFDPHHRVTPDTRRAYGEDRFQLVGKIDGRVFVLAFTLRAGVVRIISARKANAREVLSHERHAKDD